LQLISNSFPFDCSPPTALPCSTASPHATAATISLSLPRSNTSSSSIPLVLQTRRIDRRTTRTRKLATALIIYY